MHASVHASPDLRCNLSSAADASLAQRVALQMLHWPLRGSLVTWEAIHVSLRINASLRCRRMQARPLCCKRCHKRMFLTRAAVPPSQPVVHYGFIPTIILLGMTQTEPAPHFVQLLSPV